MSVKSLLTKAQKGFPTLDYEESYTLFKDLMDEYLDKRENEELDHKALATRLYVEALKHRKEIPTLLLINDEPVFSKVKDFFQQYGYYVREEPLKNALNLAKNVDFDIIMLADNNEFDEETILDVLELVTPKSYLVLLQNQLDGRIKYIHPYNSELPKELENTPSN